MEILTEDPEEALFEEAYAAERDNRPHPAVEAYSKLLRLEPRNAAAANDLGLLLKALGEEDAARDWLIHSQAVKPELRITDACRLLDGGPVFGYAPCPEARRTEACAVLKDVLRAGGYSAEAMRRRLLGGRPRHLYPPSGTELLLMRTQPALRQSLVEGMQPEGALLALFALGIALPRDVCAAAMGERCVAQLLSLGLLLHPPPEDESPQRLVAAPVQIYPLDLSLSGQPAEGAEEPADLLLATDWDIEGLLPPKWAVMPIGNDSLNLVHLAPRSARCSKVLDVCCGSGVQALSALALYANTAVCADISPRAVAFTLFNAQLNGLSDRVTAWVSDVYEGVKTLGPFDAILANPPFVAVPRPPTGLSENADWALYADGGPNGSVVLRKIVAGADDKLLRPGGWLSMVSEFPNIRSAHDWLPALGNGRCDCSFRVAVVYEPAGHTRSAVQYAQDRSDERGWPWADPQAWLQSLAEHGVDHVGTGLVFAVKGGRAAGAHCALDGPGREADLSLLESSGPIVERIRDMLLAGSKVEDLGAVAREYVYQEH